MHSTTSSPLLLMQQYGGYLAFKTSR